MRLKVEKVSLHFLWNTFREISAKIFLRGKHYEQYMKHFKNGKGRENWSKGSLIHRALDILFEIN